MTDHTQPPLTPIDGPTWAGELAGMITQHCSGLGVASVSITIRLPDHTVLADGLPDGDGGLLWEFEAIGVEGTGR